MAEDGSSNEIVNNYIVVCNGVWGATGQRGFICFLVLCAGDGN